MPGKPLRVVRPDPPRPVWLSFQPGAWVATVVSEWQLCEDGWWAEVTVVMHGNRPQQTLVKSDELRPRDPIVLGRTHRCADPP